MGSRNRIAIVRAACCEDGKVGFYNTQEIGLAKALAKNSYDVLVVFPDSSKRAPEVVIVTVAVRLIYVPCLKFGTHALFNLNILLDNNIQIVHFGCDNSPFAPATIRFCKKHGIFIYNYIGILYSKNDNKMKRILMDIVSFNTRRYYKHIITISKTPQVKEELERVGVMNSAIMPVGLDLSIIPDVLESKKELRTKLDIPQDMRVLLYVGRLDKRKRPVEAVELLNKLESDYYMVFIGKGRLEKDIFNLVQKRKLQRRFKYIREIPNEQIHEYYKASDFFINMTVSEIFGMSILEAMYQECIVVARSAPGPDYIIQNGVTGYICQSDEEMTGYIRKHRNDEMGIRARKRVMDCFTWDTTAAMIDGMIKKSNLHA